MHFSMELEDTPNVTYELYTLLWPNCRVAAIILDQRPDVAKRVLFSSPEVRPNWINAQQLRAPFFVLRSTWRAAGGCDDRQRVCYYLSGRSRTAAEVRFHGGKGAILAEFNVIFGTGWIVTGSAWHFFCCDSNATFGPNGAHIKREDNGQKKKLYKICQRSNWPSVFQRFSYKSIYLLTKIQLKTNQK